MVFRCWVLLSLLLGGPQNPVARELTPGDVLLLTVKNAPENAGILQRAIAHANPDVRAAAARVIGVTRQAAYADALASALTTEQTPRAAAEQSRALLFITGNDAVPAVELHATRVGGAAVLPLTEWLARNRIPRLIESLPLLLAATERQGQADLFPLIVLAAAETPHREKLLQRWMSATPRWGWSVVLAGRVDTPEAIAASEAILTHALIHEKDHVREETVWFLLSALNSHSGLRLPDRVVDLAQPQPHGAASQEWEVFGRELMARYTRKAQTTERPSLLQSRAYPERASVAASLKVLNKREKQAFDAAVPVGMVGPGGSIPKTPVDLKSLPIWLPGLFAHTLGSAGCRTAEGSPVAWALVTYAEDGRATSSVQVDAAEIPRECIPVLAALARTSLADADRPIVAGHQQLLMLPWTDAFVTCTGTGHGDALSRGTQTITPPKKKRHVQPRYPVEAQENRIQGTVVVEGVISETGCMRSLRVVRSAGSRALDIEAMKAASRWEFEPSRWNDVPTSVVMLLTVNFSLR